MSVLRVRRVRRVGGAAGLALVLVVLVAGAGAWVWTRQDEAVADDGPSRTPGATVTAERRDLVDAESVSGVLEYADGVTVSASGEGVLTALPAEGAVLRRGDAAYRLDDVPVTLLVGQLPLWRDLYEGVEEGRDVRQLERNLAALGHDPGTVDQDFTGATEAALLDLQEELGVDETGVATAADFVVAPGPVRVGARVAETGDQLVLGTALDLYAASGLEQVVSVELDPDDESMARAGARARVTLPDGSVVRARVASVGEVEDVTAADGTTSSVIPVTLALAAGADVDGLNAATVSVDLTRESKRDVVAVPVTALVALAEGGYAVRRVSGEESTLVAVEPGLYADGWVEVVDGLAAGDEVEVPQ